MRILVILILSLPSIAYSQKECNCDSVFTFIYDQWAEVDNMSYKSVKVERKLDEMETASFNFVVQRSPFRVAGQMIDKGHRLLYNPSINEGEALYIPSGFPFTNVWLDIHGKVFRGLNHYTISNAGCEFIFGIIKNEYDKIPDDFICSEKLLNGKKILDIYAEIDHYNSNKKYTAKAGETALSIGDKFKVMSYALIEYNKNVDNFTDDLGGQTISIPSHYGSKVRLAVSASHGMPVLIRVEDPKGLLEQYEYTNYQFDQVLPKEYFTEDYLDSLD